MIIKTMLRYWNANGAACGIVGVFRYEPKNPQELQAGQLETDLFMSEWCAYIGTGDGRYESCDTDHIAHWGTKLTPAEAETLISGPFRNMAADKEVTAKFYRDRYNPGMVWTEWKSNV